MPHTIIGDVLVDANIDENPVYSSDITEKPVEDGSAITDHIGQSPLTLSLECIISDQDAEPEEKYEELIEMWEEKEPVEVVTGLQVYENMVIDEINVTNNAEIANGFRADIEMQQVEFVGLDTIEIEIEADAEAEPSETEDRTTEEDDVDDDTIDQDWFYDLWRGAGDEE